MRRIAVVASGLTIAFVGTASAEAAQPSKGGGDSLKSGNRLAVALTDQNQLVSFKVRKPDQLVSIRSIRGLQPGVSMVGIDYRPKTGDLYGVGSNSAVYRINPQTGIAIAENVDAMGNPVPFTPGLNGTNFGIDFNPAPDAIRIVSDAGQNKRVAPDAGTTLGDDLASRLEVNTRTIRTDIERLRRLGYPVDATPGVGGGYRLGQGTTMPPLLLDDQEVVAVAVGLRTATASGVTGIEEAALRALVKLEQLMP